MPIDGLYLNFCFSLLLCHHSSVEKKGYCQICHSREEALGSHLVLVDIWRVVVTVLVPTEPPWVWVPCFYNPVASSGTTRSRGRRVGSPCGLFRHSMSGRALLKPDKDEHFGSPIDLFWDHPHGNVVLPYQCLAGVWTQALTLLLVTCTERQPQFLLCSLAGVVCIKVSV
jgi:hypothetical protein